MPLHYYQVRTMRRPRVVEEVEYKTGSARPCSGDVDVTIGGRSDWATTIDDVRAVVLPRCHSLVALAPVGALELKGTAFNHSIVSHSLEHAQDELLPAPTNMSVTVRGQHLRFC